MIQQLEDVYNEFAGRLDAFEGSKIDFSSLLEYKKLWAETMLPFAEKLNNTAMELERSRQFDRKEIMPEVNRLMALYKDKI